MTATAEAIVQSSGEAPRACSSSTREDKGTETHSGGSIARVAETLTLLLVATVHFMWVIFAHPTPDERARPA
jgi:hypothetical protein